MNINCEKAGALVLLSALALPVSGPLAAQNQQAPDQQAQEGKVLATVYGSLPSDLSALPQGPEIKGFISARNGRRMQVTGEDGNRHYITVTDATQIKSRGGFLGLSSNKLAMDALTNGLPVTVQTVQWGEGLLASRIKFRNKDQRTASMIRNGTAQKFAQHDQEIGQNKGEIEKNRAAAEALRGRVGDIDKYNIKNTTNVYFDTGKWKIKPSDERALCEVAQEAEAMNNALLLVVGYTDSVGSQEYNQVLSERRAGRVVNYLQQACGWKPWRMLTPTGMAEADPAADNSTAYGKAQNRRVSVNILVSKGLDGL